MDVELNKKKDAGTLHLITPDQANHYRSQLANFQRLFGIDQKKFDSSPDSTYFIVSTKFLESWRDFCISNQAQRHLPIPLNSDLVDRQTNHLRQGLKQKQDFQLVSQDTYALFAEFKCIQLKRTAIKIGHEKRVPIYLNTYQYLCITNYDLKQIDLKSKRRQDFILKNIQESQNATVKDLSAKIAAIQENELGYNQRLWRIDNKENMDTLFKYLKAAAYKANSDYRIRGFGKKLLQETRIEDLQMEEGDFFLVQVREKNRRWFLQSENQKKCEGCYDVMQLKFPCPCEKVAYCTQECKDKDKKFHLRMCEYAEMEQLSKKIDMSVKKGAQWGLVGLRNLGNTCFMNSCLQCLSNTVPLTRYFLDSCFEYQINRTNTLGTKGKLAKAYAKFIKGMWCQTDSVYVPDDVKSAVSSINHIFSGYSQHDSHEFFSFLIDGLHEDLNRIVKKPYFQSLDSGDRPDAQVALQSWLDHIKRNQSVITDLMTGQYRSKVTCPSCNKECITFDPFITVTLPIPQNVINTFTCFVIFKNFQQSTKKVSFSYSKPNIEDWTNKIARLVQVDQKSLLIYLVSQNQGIYRASKESLASMVDKMQSQSRVIFAVQLTDEELSINNKVEFTGRFSKSLTYSNQSQNLWFKFPYFFNGQGTTGLVIYKRMLRFLYNQCYNQRTNKLKDLKDKSYQEYESLMLSKRPFQIFVRYGKKIDKFYRRSEFTFEKEIHFNDEMTLTELLTKIKPTDCELDMRVSEQGLTLFNFERLKQFQETVSKIKSPSYSSYDREISLESCFDTLSQAEQLQAGNQWYCPTCKQHRLATKQMSVYKAPKVLILHLKRFKQKGVYRKQKNESKVLFPMVLNMKPFLIDPHPFSSYLQQSKQKQIYVNPKYPQVGKNSVKNSSQPIYDLYAVSNHYGGLGGGHYTAFAKNGQKWYDFNDSSVRPVSEASVIGSGAYILFYTRRD